MGPGNRDEDGRVREVYAGVWIAASTLWSPLMSVSLPSMLNRPFTAASLRNAQSLVATVLVVGGLSACGSVSVQERATKVTQTSGNAAAGAKVFKMKCSRCHGKTGARMDHHDLTSAAIRAKPASELATTILKGDGHMPAFAGTLDDQGIADVLAWIRRER